jgi:hypothetical protein
MNFHSENGITGRKGYEKAITLLSYTACIPIINLNPEQIILTVLECQEDILN